MKYMDIKPVKKQKKIKTTVMAAKPQPKPMNRAMEVTGKARIVVAK